MHPADADIEEILDPSSTHPCWIELSHLKLVKVTGSDAENFLQAQFSNDIGNLDSNNAQLQAYCNPKGRAIAILRVMRREQGGFWILIPDSIAEPLLKRLQMFVLRAEVKFELEQQNTALGALQPVSPNAGAEEHFHVEGIRPRKIAIFQGGKPENGDDQPGRILHGDFWKLLDIHSGIPQVYGETSEAFIPQYINLDLVDGVSFRKGCYPGQEIVARLKYLGKTKQRLAIATITGNNPIFPGNPVFHDDRPDQKAGLVVDCVQIGENNWTVSVVIPLVLGETGSLHIESVSGPALALQPLPYDIPRSDAEASTRQ